MPEYHPAFAMTDKKKKETDNYLRNLLGDHIYDPRYYDDPDIHSCASTEDVVKPIMRRKYVPSSREE